MDKIMKRPARLHARLYVYRSKEDTSWWCAVPYLGKDGKRHQRRATFHDSKNGGNRKALIMAQAWRDKEIKKPEVQAVMGDRRVLTLFVSDENEQVKGRNNPFGMVGVTASFRKKPLGGNFSVTANGRRKKWFSMRHYGAYEAFKMAVQLRCEWVGAKMPSESDLRFRYDRWARSNAKLLASHGVSP